ncbi:MAG: Bacterial rane protein YfhO [Planctomycetota bacterium]|nr:Bacterial rane protein YfhO [Planctomycetota bacterium]
MTSSDPAAKIFPWTPDRTPWSRADGAAILAWTVAIVIVFRDAALFRGALFYFDITELNYPYRAFLFRELAAGRFSRWLPNLYCGMPLFSESQAGYLHPWKYLFYPWMETWKAFNLDTVGSIWLTGLGAYGWLRRHVGSVGALTGASIVALGGYTWAHLIHTSMINALASVPFAIWALEAAWDRARLRAMVLGAIALACQVFAGHLQDTILTSSALGVYAVLRASGERTWSARGYVLGTAAGMVLLAGVLSAVQWIPSKELLDRSPRSGGLTWDDLTYGSWHPQLLPTLVLHEAYGTRARDTDWMDGFFPYHEMDTYLGVVGLFLAFHGARAYRNRWVASWLVIGAIGAFLMLGRNTFLIDYLHRVPIVGSSRIPVRFHLWVTLATAALAAVGVDRLARPGVARLKGPVLAMALLIAASLAIVVVTYLPVWKEASRWTQKDHSLKFAWLGSELSIAASRNLLLLLASMVLASKAARSTCVTRRAAWAALLPVLGIVDMAAAHGNDVPTIDPSFWTQPPESVMALRHDPTLIRMVGERTYSSGEPGHASKPVHFMTVRDVLAWSLPAVWDLRSTAGETPIISRRRVRFGEWQAPARYDLEGLSHVLSATPSVKRLGPFVQAGTAYIHRNIRALPRVRIVSQPVYADDERSAAEALKSLGAQSASRIVVEDPDRPLSLSSTATGTARIVREVADRVEIETETDGPAYLLISDTYDPGWSATVDGRPMAVRAANVAFRAVFVPGGSHSVIFHYVPAGFHFGLTVALVGCVFSLGLLAWRTPVVGLDPEHGATPWPKAWPLYLSAILTAVIVLSVFRPAPGWKGVGIQSRWVGSFHPFTWGAKIEAIKPPPPPMD